MSWLKKLFPAPEPRPRILSGREKRDAETRARWAQDRRAVGECMPEILAGIHTLTEKELGFVAAVVLPLPVQVSPPPGRPLK